MPNPYASLTTNPPKASYPPVSNDLDILFAFLQSREPEVSGHAAAEVSADLRERVVRFATGQSSESERDKVKKLLREQPDLIPVLVSEIRTLREKTS